MITTRALAEVAQVNPTTTIRLESEDVCSFVSMDSVDETTASISRVAYRPYGEVAKGYTSFSEDDVLIAKITPCMENGKCAIARRLKGGVGFGSTEFHVIRASKEVLPEWIYYFWRRPETRAIAERNMTGSAGQRRVPSGFVEQLELPVPSIVEQMKSVAKLKQADRLCRTRRYTLQLCDDLLVAGFIAIAGDPLKRVTPWECLPIEYFATVQTGNTPPRDNPRYFGRHIEWIKSDNITLCALAPTRAAECLSEEGLVVGRSVQPGSILMTCIAGSLNSIGNVVVTDRAVAYNQQINAITPHEGVDSIFLYGLLRVAKPIVQAAATEAMKKMITKGKLEEVRLPIPPLPVQTNVARYLVNQLALRSTHAEALRQADHLFDTLLHQTFHMD